MPSLDSVYLTDLATLRAAIGYDEQGNPVLGEPQELMTRWVDTVKETQDAQNNVSLIEATVTVDRAVQVNSVMRRGSVEAGDGEGWCRVVGRVSTPDVKGRSRYYTLNLSKFRGQI